MLEQAPRRGTLASCVGWHRQQAESFLVGAFSMRRLSCSIGPEGARGARSKPAESQAISRKKKSRFVRSRFASVSPPFSHPDTHLSPFLLSHLLLISRSSLIRIRTHMGCSGAGGAEGAQPPLVYGPKSHTRGPFSESGKTEKGGGRVNPLAT